MTRPTEKSETLATERELNRPCPTCHEPMLINPNRVTPLDVNLRYQCNVCTIALILRTERDRIRGLITVDGAAKISMYATVTSIEYSMRDMFSADDPQFNAKRFRNAARILGGWSNSE